MRNIEKKILKVFLLCHIQNFFYDLFKTPLLGELVINNADLTMENYVMDNKILQLVIKGIVDTGEYTLEGISNYTKIPFDLIFDVTCGINKQLTITPWSKIIELYMQVKPEVSNILLDKIRKLINEKNIKILSSLSEV